MSPQREPDDLLIRFAQDIGTIREGVRNLDEGQRKVDKKITGLQRTVAELVTRADCKARHADVTERIDTALFAAAQPAPPQEQGKAGILELAGKKAGAIAAILSLLAMIVVGVVVIARFVGSLERAIDADRKAQETANKELVQALRGSSKPVAPALPAVAPEPDAGPTTRRRRGRRGKKESR